MRRAYFDVLRAEATAKVSKETLGTRGVQMRQIQTLADNELRSTLDVSFAQVAVSEAELLVATAENQIRQALAALEGAMGVQLANDVTLAPPPESPALEQAAAAYLPEALSNRPDVAALRFRVQARESAALGEHRLTRPVITADAVMGGIPLREDGVRAAYGAAGVNVAIPVFNGKKILVRMMRRMRGLAPRRRSSRSARESSRAGGRLAWFQADTAWRRIELMQRLFDQSAEALRLAQTRYELGLSSIVELNQAQLSRTAAEIGLATARYDYEASRAVLLFAIGSQR